MLRREVRYLDDWNLGHAQQFGGSETSVSRYDIIGRVDQNRIHEPELTDVRGDLRDVVFSVPSLRSNPTGATRTIGMFRIVRLAPRSRW